jgi:mannitol-specific phosphotransferase system IIBC component
MDFFVLALIALIVTFITGVVLLKKDNCEESDAFNKRIDEIFEEQERFKARLKKIESIKKSRVNGKP